ncbi:DcaP family trimeric outer membrane transporter [Rheinheimera sp. UJ63]|uniref:DcaP family trimeric outer membrane transporter n=1 Tax=Rheinheimera sp. UJ63 TaxID=2910157 RepID=UPI001F411595|nr:DcaP family trimeric outer membrane transporter [Rheinheimera sp. UJ63]MCF4009463.1 porin family protein [Rheinheimera sp. UJ63]
MRQCKTRNTLAAAIALALTAGAAHANNGFKVGDTEVSYGGYVKLDMMVSDADGDIASIGRDFYVPSVTPINGDSTTRFDMHARQTRFFFSTSTDLGNGEKMTGRIEFDFQTSNNGNDERTTNGYSPVMRHAFVNYKNWTVGQTWSNFMDLQSLPDTLDFVGNADAAIFIRQAQVRYTSGNFSIAVENPESTVTPFGGGTRITTDDNATPDFTVGYNFKTENASFRVAGLLRQIAIENGVLDDSVASYGVSFSGKFNLANKDDIRFTINTGEGLGRYVGLNASNGAVLTGTTSDAELETIKSTSFSVAYRHLWNDKWRSTFLYSALNVDNDTSLTGTSANKSMQSYSVNALYQFNTKFMMGVEYKYANREIESGLDGDMHRVQFSAKYDF